MELLEKCAIFGFLIIALYVSGCVTEETPIVPQPPDMPSTDVPSVDLTPDITGDTFITMSFSTSTFDFLGASGKTVTEIRNDGSYIIQVTETDANGTPTLVEPDQGNIERETLEALAQQALDAQFFNAEDIFYGEGALDAGGETFTITIGDETKTIEGYALTLTTPKAIGSLVRNVRKLEKAKKFVWFVNEPTQCNTNPWDEDFCCPEPGLQADGNPVTPSEEGTISSYLHIVHFIDVLDVVIIQEEGITVCEACSCWNGAYAYAHVSVTEEQRDILKAENWTESISPYSS